MAFYGLNFGEKALKHPPMKSRDASNRSYVPVKDAPRRPPVFADPTDSLPQLKPLDAASVTGKIGSRSLPETPRSRPADRPLSAAPTAAVVSQPAAPAAKPRREVALVFQLPSAKKEQEIFDRVDFNGNGMLSLAELDKAVVELWPRFNNKPAILRAYKAADANGTGFVSRREFSLFLRFLVRFTEVWCLFTQMDTNGDRRLSFEEFVEGAHLAGLNQTPNELRKLFDSMDTNRGGVVLFDEFCTYLADEDIKEARQALKLNAKKSAKVPKKIEFLQLPPVKDIRKLFEQLDMNRNNCLSLAELDKAVVELWPQFNNKPALMRAYKAADLSGNGLLSRKEFTAFLQFLVVFQNLWQKFEVMDENGDRRLSIDEFLKHGPKIDPFHTKSRNELESIFRSLDTNGGGYVLFDEFCNYAAADVVKEFFKQTPHPSETKASPAASSFQPAACTLVCHVCGKLPADYKAHVAACSAEFQSKMKGMPSFLQRPPPVMPVSFPTKPQDVDRFNTVARMVHDSVATLVCPECSKSFPAAQFFGHFKTHNISYNRRMELEKLATLRRPTAEHLVIPPSHREHDAGDVAFDIKLQCVAPFDLTKLNALRRLMYIKRVHSPMVSLDELSEVLRNGGVKIDKERVSALLGLKERNSIVDVMTAIDQAGCSQSRRDMLRNYFAKLDVEKVDSVEYRQLRIALPSEQLREMFARPLERHVSSREFEGVLADLSVLYPTDSEFRKLFEYDQPRCDALAAASQVKDERHRIRITTMAGEVKVVEISATGPAMKLDKVSLKRRLSLLGITDVQKLELVQ